MFFCKLQTAFFRGNEMEKIKKTFRAKRNIFSHYAVLTVCCNYATILSACIPDKYKNNF
jgi:hypothetical protein